MRVISGKAKRISLTTVEGELTRPTTDRIKETLFNMLQYDIADTNFLDLFAGSGAIGIEALSRGANHCVFIEQQKEAIRCIRENLNATKLQELSTVIESDALSGINRIKDKNLYFDYIFMDPPYDMGLEKEVLFHMKDMDFFDKNSTIIIEASLHTDFSYLNEYGYTIENEKRYKTNKHIFLYRGE